MAIKPVAFLINTNYDEKLMVITRGPAEGIVGCWYININQPGLVHKENLTAPMKLLHLKNVQCNSF